MRDADVVADVVELVNLLDMARASMIGWSEGRPYVLACGALVGKRCTSVAVVCSPREPLTERDTTPEELVLSHRVVADPEAHRGEVGART
jgi:hypothetical protein